jgi:hypothetical protein
MVGSGSDHGPESVRTLCEGLLCRGCGQTFTPTRSNQRHCQAACRKRAERHVEAQRRQALLERIDGDNLLE